MNTCLVDTSECLGNPIEYSLISDLSEVGIETYGVLVQLGNEQVLIPDLSSSSNAVRELLTQMAGGGVSPIAVHDIVEDWLLR